MAVPKKQAFNNRRDMKSASELALVFFLMAAGTTALGAAAPTIGAGPRIQFEAPVYDFGKVSTGQVLKHEFVFTNMGDRILEIKGVQTSCGCTTAGNWSRQVEPGQQGTIPIEFHSTNFNGPVTKLVTVTCNDTNQPQVKLQIKGTLWRPIEVMPQSAVLNVLPDSPTNAFTVVRIVSNLDKPLILSAPESNHRALAVELKTNQPGKEFQLVIKAVPPLGSGNVFGRITMKTSAPEMPILEVSAYATAPQPVTVTPSNLVLPGGPLTNKLMRSVSIRSVWSSPLTLTNAVLNARGVNVQLRELQPGRYFTVTLTFPEGFEVAKGEQVELSVKSNHPQFPLIKVPITQLPRPVPPPVPLVLRELDPTIPLAEPPYPPAIR
jgi:hypothetical protein